MGATAASSTLCEGPGTHSGNSDTESKLKSKKAGECPRGKQGLWQSETGFHPEVEPADDVARTEGIFCDLNQNKPSKTGEAGETGQCLRKPTALAEDLSSVPRTHTRQLGTSWNSSSRGSSTLYWSLKTPALMHVPIYRHTQLKKTKILKQVSVLPLAEPRLPRTLPGWLYFPIRRKGIGSATWWREWPQPTTSLERLVSAMDN